MPGLCWRGGECAVGENGKDMRKMQKYAGNADRRVFQGREKNAQSIFAENQKLMRKKADLCGEMRIM